MAEPTNTRTFCMLNICFSIKIQREIQYKSGKRGQVQLTSPKYRTHLRALRLRGKPKISGPLTLLKDKAVNLFMLIVPNQTLADRSLSKATNQVELNVITLPGDSCLHVLPSVIRQLWQGSKSTAAGGQFRSLIETNGSVRPERSKVSNA